MVTWREDALQGRIEEVIARKSSTKAGSDPFSQVGEHSDHGIGSDLKENRKKACNGKKGMRAPIVIRLNEPWIFESTSI